MEMLPEKFNYRDFTYIQDRRSKHHAIYQQWLGNDIIGFEVIKIKHQKAGEFNGIKFSEKELYPNDKDWGTSAWTCKDLKGAIKRYNDLVSAEIK